MTTTDQIHAEALKVAETLPIFGLFKISPAIPNDPRRIVMPADIERILEVGRLIGLEQAKAALNKADPYEHNDCYVACIELLILAS